MSRIEEIDKNLKVQGTLERDDICFYNCAEEPFRIFGVLKPSEEEPYFRRLPQAVADATNAGVGRLSHCPAGGRVRFRTDSPFVAIHAEMDELCQMPHIPYTGSIGMDLYEWRDGQEHYVKTFVPPMDIVDGYESIIEFPEEEPARERELVLNMSLYSGVKKLLIGVAKDAHVWEGRGYKHDVPVVYYGSSITQGGCASRPGNSYQSIISRRLDCDYINLGFSGSARAEKAIREYISTMTMSVFVYDYDHNATTVKDLAATHQLMFSLIREKNPDLPIVMVSRPMGYTLDAAARFEVIKKTYEDALAAGDKHVYLIDGREMVADVIDGWCVDGIHPTDLGFRAMADAIGAVVGEILNEK